MARLFFNPEGHVVDSAGTPYPGAKANFYLTTTTTRADTYQENALSTPHANPVVADSAGKFPPIYLTPGTTYRCIITDSDDVQLSDTDPVHAPFDASAVAITDAGGYFSDSDVEDVLQDIGANYAKLAQDEDISGDWTVSGSMNFQDNPLKRAMLQDCAYKNQALVSSGNAIAWDIQQGEAATHLLTENTTITLSNWVAADDCQVAIIKVKQDNAGGAYTLAFSATSVQWGDGAAPSPVMPTGNSSERIYVIKTWDAGSTIYIDYAGAYG